MKWHKFSEKMPEEGSLLVKDIKNRIHLAYKTNKKELELGLDELELGHDSCCSKYCFPRREEIIEWVYQKDVI